MADNTYDSFKSELDKELKKQNISWEKSVEQRQALAVKGGFLGVLAIIILLIVTPIMDIMGKALSAGAEKSIATALFIFIVIALIFFYRKLFLGTKDTLNPWITGFLSVAIASKKYGVFAGTGEEKPKGPVKKSMGGTLAMSLFFWFFGFLLLVGSSGDGKAVSAILGIGFFFMFGLIGLIGILKCIAFKKPDFALFLLRHSLITRIIMFLIAVAAYGTIASAAFTHFVSG